MSLPNVRKLRIVGEPMVVPPPPPPSPSFAKSDRSKMGLESLNQNRGSVGSETRFFKHHIRYPNTTKHVYMRKNQIVSIATTTLKPKRETDGEGVMSIHRPIKPLIFK